MMEKVKSFFSVAELVVNHSSRAAEKNMI